ncbi:MAG: sensor histidine kinase [Chitinophagaceae bacterium]|nr:MAG: sensor histidine kinase [Chitinophagaceae bacterium]
MNLARSLERTGRLVAAVALFCALLMFLVWYLILRQLGESRQVALDAAVQRNNNLVVTLEQQAIRTIRNADALLQLVRYEYSKSGKAIDLEALLERGVIDMHYIAGVSIVDSAGHMQISNTPIPAAAADVSDREHFLFHKRFEDSLYIGLPIHSRTLNRTVIVLSRRLSRPDGSFGGTVAVQVEPSTFIRYYAQANLRPHDLISLIAPNGITYARRTGDKESWGEDIHKSPLFNHLARRPVGHYFAADAIYGIPTWFSFRKLTGYPMIATVGASEQDILAEQRALAGREYRFGAAISVLLLLFSVMVIAVLLQRRKRILDIQAAEQQRRREQKRYQRRLTQQIIAAQERERESIGRELHDNVNQVLTTVKLNIELAQGSPGLSGDLLQRSVRYLQQCIAEIRNLSRELSAPTLGTSSLVDSVAALVEMVAPSANLDIRFNHETYRQGLPKEQKLALYRILQEALNNVMRHAEARKVDIELRQAGGVTILSVTDDGKGFTPGSPRGGIGLTNMRSRAAVLGGTLQIQSAPGRGCQLQVRVPIPGQVASPRNA